MTMGDAQTGIEGGDSGGSLNPAQLALQAELAGSNINENTFLATDYLNHLNEAVMMIELVPGAPDMLEEALSWRPKTYQEHFLSSDLAVAELACRAYEIAPERFRLPFDLTVKAIQRRISTALAELEPLVEAGDQSQVGLIVLSSCKAVQDLIGVAAAIVNGSERMADCASSTEPAAEAEEDETTMSQAEIDALFG